MDESKFCTGCGKPIEPGMQFCPQCGMVVSGSAADEQFKENEKEIRGILIQSRRNWLIFFLAIYAIPVIIAAIIALVDASSSANAIWENASFQKWLSEHHISMTVNDIQNYITGAATMALLSGICAGVSLVCVYLRKKWIIAVIACFAAAILCVWSIFGIIIGFLVGWMIITSKDVFNDWPEGTETEE